MANFRLRGSKATRTLIFTIQILEFIVTFNTADGNTIRYNLFEGVRLFIGRIRIAESDSGETNLNVIGGENSQPGQWPWMASLQYFDQWDGSYFHVCGAAVLSDQWLLTAAHCVDGNLQNDPGRGEAALYRVMLGGVNLYFPSNRTQFVGLLTIIIHPFWRADAKRGFPNDLALLRLAGRADLTRMNIGAIDLPLNENADYRQQQCWIIGWGVTNVSADYPPEILQHGLTPVIENTLCQHTMPMPVLLTHICIGVSDRPRACEGDSGSPLACTDGSLWTVAGIGSWAKVDCGGSSVYTRTSKYLEWISSTISM